MLLRWYSHPSANTRFWFLVKPQNVSEAGFASFVRQNIELTKSTVILLGGANQRIKFSFIQLNQQSRYHVLYFSVDGRNAVWFLTGMRLWTKPYICVICRALFSTFYGLLSDLLKVWIFETVVKIRWWWVGPPHGTTQHRKTPSFVQVPIGIRTHDVLAPWITGCTLYESCLHYSQPV